MSSHIEVWGNSGPRVVVLEGERATIGKDASNTICIDESVVSRMHAALEQYPAGWAVRDLDSHNGTYLNGKRLLAERRLQSGDEIRIGATRLVFRGDEAKGSTVTEAGLQPPDLTKRERDVLVSLCRPVLGGHVFTEPASIKQIAADLIVSEDAVKQHLSRLYEKFSLSPEETERRRVRLANEALRRGAVSLADLRELEP